MAEAKNPVTLEQAEKNKEDDFTRAQERRAEMARRRGGFEHSLPAPEEIQRHPSWVEPTSFTSAPASGMTIVSGKAAKILQGLNEGEPIFIFRAQDILSVMVLSNYAKLLEDYLGVLGNEQIASVVDVTNQFRAWQQANPGKVKLPD